MKKLEVFKVQAFAMNRISMELKGIDGLWFYFEWFLRTEVMIEHGITYQDADIVIDCQR